MFNPRNYHVSARDRLLEATAFAANALLTVENFDEAVNTALQIIGEGLDCDRVCLGEHCNDLSGETLGFVRYSYEWTSPLILGQRIEGCFVLCSRDDRHYTTEEIELAQALAHQVTLAVQLTHLAEQAKQAVIL